MNKPGKDIMIVRDLGFSLLAEGRILKIKADGYSMYPSIKPGTTIFIETLAENKILLPGEIIAWKRESGFVVHRFARSEYKGNEVFYYTRGDSCIREDEPVTRDQIAGKVIRTEDRKGRIKEGDKMITKPCNFTNRIIVRLLLFIHRSGYYLF
ncbi:MAG TPA: hypothetical protein DDW27_09010 [Bacteroidales bacterium]|nr:hypothetical protein [Bacteroidales bacterium]